MFNVLLIDRSNSAVLDLAIHLANHVDHPDVRIVLLSDKEPSGFRGNLEVVNLHSIPQSLSLATLQSQHDFSFHKALVPERAFFDYSSFRKTQCYSNMSLDRVYEVVTPYLNALDYLIRERADLVIEGLADNFMTSVAGRMAARYRKKFYMAFMYYWAGNGFYFVDRCDQTSSLIDSRYEYHLEQVAKLDRKALDEMFARKALNVNFGNHYTLRARLEQWLKRSRSYEPMSIRHWLLRRLGWMISKTRISLSIRFETSVGSEKFVLFPLHVTPEATLLGSVPELADQFWLIKNLSMNLPAGVMLYVKEHPHQQLGLGLDYDFYRRVLSLPNVRLVSGSVPADTLYRHPGCIAVAVIAGTVGLEAALSHVPVFVFGRPIYHRGDCFTKLAGFDEFFAAVASILRGEYRFNDAALYAMLQALKDAVVEADVDLSSARSWLELGYLGNANTIKFIHRQYQEWIAARTDAGVSTSTRHANAH